MAAYDKKTRLLSNEAVRPSQRLAKGQFSVVLDETSNIAKSKVTQVFIACPAKRISRGFPFVSLFPWWLSQQHLLANFES